MKSEIEAYVAATKAQEEAGDRLLEVMWPIAQKHMENKDLHGLYDLINMLPENWIHLHKLYQAVIEIREEQGNPI